MDPALLAEMFRTIEAQAINIHSVLVIRHGYIVAEAYYPPFTEESQREVFSVTKSVMSALIGIGLNEGAISGLDRPVLDFFPGRTFAQPDPRKTAMTLENLLTMTAGLDWEDTNPVLGQMTQSPDWVAFVLDRPMVEAPGRRFNYCSGCSHLLSAILQETTGQKTFDYAQAHLFGPLGITHFTWQRDRQGIALGGWGLQMTPRDMAKFGYLYLHGGAWDGQQLVPAEWVRRSTARHVETDSTLALGYGYQWWRDPAVDAYMARGRGGQLIYVAPGPDLVVVFTADLPDDAALLELIHTTILPAALLPSR